MPMVIKTWQGGAYNKELQPFVSYDLPSLALVRSCDTLNVLYLYLQQSNEHQTWQGGNLS